MKPYDQISESIKVMLEYHCLNNSCGLSPQEALYESISAALKITNNDTLTVSQLYKLSEALIMRIQEENP